MRPIPSGPDLALPSCDIQKRYVRIGERRDGFIMFEFSIGWEELMVELMLPPQAFDAFCAANRVVLLPPRSKDDEDHAAPSRH